MKECHLFFITYDNGFTIHSKENFNNFISFINEDFINKSYNYKIFTSQDTPIASKCWCYSTKYCVFKIKKLNHILFFKEINLFMKTIFY